MFTLNLPRRNPGSGFILSSHYIFPEASFAFLFAKLREFRVTYEDHTNSMALNVREKSIKSIDGEAGDEIIKFLNDSF